MENLSFNRLRLLVGIVLASAFWIASVPVAQAQQTPVEMIQSQLPSGKTIASASDTELLDAVCKAVRKWPNEASPIVKTAGTARPKLRAEVLCTAIRCLRNCAWSVDILREWTQADPKDDAKDGPSDNKLLCTVIRCLRDGDAFDCACVVDIVRLWIKAEPNEASWLTELMLQCAPDCADLLQGAAGSERGFGNPPPSNINPPPGSFGAPVGGNTCIVCHNGQELQIACSDLESYLRSHPGDTPGACQPTPITNL